MKFDAKVALEYARAIARPRCVGSGEDRVVAQEIASQLERFGCQVERQQFQFSTAPSGFIFLEVLVGLLLISAAILARGIAVWASVVLVATLLSLFILSGAINRAVEAGSVAPESSEKMSQWSALCLRIGAQHTTANLVAALPGSADDAVLPHLYLVAHYDSKSQRMPLAVRAALFTVALTGGLAFAGLTLLGLAFPALTLVAPIVGLAALAAGFPLLFLNIGNDSPGAIDNASGVGVVLHLAECLAQQPHLLERVRATILITSAEEMSLMGASAFVRTNKDKLRHEAEAGGLYILNFDGPGVDGKLVLAGERICRPCDMKPILADLIREAGYESGMQVGRFLFLGAMFDHAPFARCGFDAVSLLAIGQDSWAVHTSNDSVDKLNMLGFERAGQVTLRVIERIASGV